MTEAGHPPIPSSADWFERVPKVELHVHLEGAIPLDALWQLVLKYGGDPSVPDRASLAAAFTYRDFPHFLDTWVWKNRFLREYEDFAFIAEAVARDFAAQSIKYAEVFFSPPDFAGAGLEPEPLAEAVRRGLARVPDVRVALVADLVRDFGPAAGDALLSRLADIRDRGIVGIGLGGTEYAFPPAPFAGVYERARSLGFRTTIHAGEGAGPGSVRAALRRLKPDRIGHATRAAEDPALVEELRAAAVPLELCPVSNVRTGVVRSLAEHPIRRFFDRGLRLSVNTDDPQMFGTRLADEYRSLAGVFGFSPGEIRSLILRAVSDSWLADDAKRALRRELEGDPAWLGDEGGGARPA